MTTLEEFRSKRNLIDQDFEGYKLSLKPIPKTELDLKFSLSVVIPNEDQYSYKHAKLFTIHNFLHHDNFNCLHYFFDSAKNLHVVGLNDTSELEEPVQVWRIPEPSLKQFYNSSLVFPSTDIALISDGAFTLYVLDTGKRKDKYNWSVLVKETFDFPFVLKQAEIFSEEKELHCLLYHVVYEGSRHKWSVAWVIYSQNDVGEWKQKSFKNYESTGDLFTSCFSSKGELWIASESGFSHEDKKADYDWSQENGQIKIKLNVTEKNVDVETERNFIRVKSENNTFMEGRLYDIIEPGLTQWNRNDDEGFLEISLFKVKKENEWPELIDMENLQDDKKLPQETEVILNSNQVEECDYPESTSNILECFSRESTVKRINLSTYRPLFQVDDVEGKSRAFAIQQDEHIILWNVDDECHSGTLMAMGYIQASKQKKKFVFCSPNLNYSVVCENIGHLFIYRHNISINESDLRNRVSGKRVKKISQQQVVNLNDQVVMGIHCDDDTLYILTTNKLHAFFMEA